MNACSAFDFGCRVNEALAPVIFWGKVGLIAVVVLAGLAGLAWVYRNFGWWGVGIALTLGATAAIFKKGVDFGRRFEPLPAPKKDLKPDVTKRLRTPKGRPKPYIDPDTGTWYDNK